jgi:hypothetical protein
MRDGLFRLIDAADFVTLSQKVDEITTSAAARVEHAHPTSEATLQELVEQIDVDAAEPLLQIYV